MMSQMDQKSLSLVRAALDLRSGKEYDHAIDLLKKALELEPNNIYALLTLGLTYQEIGKLNEAENVFRKALFIDPQNNDVLRSLGMLLLAQSRINEAIVYFQKRLEPEPDNREALDVLIPAFLKENRFEDAEKVLLAAWNYGSSIHSGTRYVRLLISSGQIEKAQTFLKNAPQTEDSPNLLAELALTYAIMDKYPEAAAALEKAITIDPSYDRALRGLAQCYTRLNQPEKALEFAEKALVLNPKHYRNWEAKADALIRLGRLEQAIEASRIGESFIQPGDEEALPVLEMLYLQQLSMFMQIGDIPNALNVSQKGRDKFPTREDFYVLAVQDLLYKNDIEGALSLFGQAEKSGVPLDRDLAPFYFQTLHQANRPAEALKFIEPLLRKNKKKQLDDLASVGITLYQLGHISSSQAVFEQLIHLDPEDARFAMNYAFILTGEGDYQKAESLLLQALSDKDSESTFVISCNLGFLYLLQERYPKAKTIFTKVLTTAPEDEGAILRVAYWFDEKIIPDFAPHSMRSARIVTTARANLVAWALSQGQIQQGEKWAREIIADEPENPLGHEVLGCVFRAHNKSQESILSLSKALELAEQPAEKAMLTVWINAIKP